MNDTVIKIDNVSKSYKLYNHHHDRVKEAFHPFRKKYHHKFNALSNISFEVKQGETVGIIGKNGSGKSTLLEIICGILEPTSGTVHVNGKISALLELGAGFNPVYTGRQNIYMYSTILGLNQSEIDDRFESIADFADIGEFIDQPLKIYSSGMYIRLAFAVAIHVNPKILIIDEAIAVGDAEFQYKCFCRFEEMQQQGTTIIVVAHDVGSIKKFCNRAIWINKGIAVNDGDSILVADQYQDFIRKKQFACHNKDYQTENPMFPPNNEETNHKKDAGRIVDVKLFNAQGQETYLIHEGDDMFVSITYELYNNWPERLIIGAAINRSDRFYVCGLNTGIDNFDIPLQKGVHTIWLKFNKFPVLSGTYSISAGLFDKTAMVIWDIFPDACEFQVSSPYIAEGLLALDHEWQPDNS